MKQRKSKNRMRKVIVAMIFTMLIVPFVGGSEIKAAETPKAWVTPYSSGISANAAKKTSRLYEVKTSGFAEEAYLEYSYNNYLIEEYKEALPFLKNEKVDAKIKIYRTNRTSEGGSGESYICGKGRINNLHDFRFFAVRSGELAREGKLEITVKDVNPESPTIGKEAKYTFEGAGWSDLGTDLNKGAGSMWVGETKELRLLLASGGMPMDSEIAYGGLSQTDQIRFINQAEGTDMETVGNITDTSGNYIAWLHRVTATKAGGSTLNVGHERKISLGGLITLDPYYNNVWVIRGDFPMVYGSFDIYAFDRPNIKSNARKITINNAVEGITYTLGYESFTCTKKGQKIVFGERAGTDGFLMPGGQFQLELSTKVNGKIVRIIEDVTTNGYNHVTFNDNGVTPDKALETVHLAYQKEKMGERTLTAPGYTFLGWNTKPDGTGETYTEDSIVLPEYLTLYAQWYKKSYRADISVNLDNKPFTSASVGLYQDGKEIYPLENKGKGYYTGKGISYSKYAADDVAYDIYVDGVDSGVDYKLSGREDDDSVIKADVHCFDIKVGLKYNDAIWKDQKVLLTKSGVEYATRFDDTTNMYTYRLLYGTDAPKDGDYLIYVNDKLVENASGIDKIVVSNDLKKNEREYSYYDVVMDVKKDGIAWDGAEVTLKQNNKKIYTMEYDVTSGLYKTNGIIDFKQSYDVFIKGSNSKEDVNLKLNATTKKGSVDYYTVDFKDAKDTAKTYNTQVLIKGTNARKPSTPYKQGSTFDKWNTKVDGTGDNPFAGGVSVTEPITETTQIWATWQEPQLKLGSILRCDENGKKNGKGKYYRFANISITGFPGADKDTPILTAVFDSNGSVIKTLSTPIGGSVQGNGTDKVTIYFKPGIKMNEAEEYLSKNVIVKPKATAGHSLTGKVFGVTG